MGVRVKNPKKPWTPGKEMPEFSGKTWSELKDIYPFDLRIKDNAWMMIGLVYPAWILTKNQFQVHLGTDKIRFRDFLMLCWMLRVQEGYEDVAFRSWQVMKGVNLSGQLLYNKKAILTKLGLIENLPTKRVRLYRVTQMGKMMCKTYTENLNRANENLTEWINAEDEENRKKITRALDNAMPGWNLDL